MKQSDPVKTVTAKNYSTCAGSSLMSACVGEEQSIFQLIKAFSPFICSILPRYHEQCIILVLTWAFVPFSDVHFDCPDALRGLSEDGTS